MQLHREIQALVLDGLKTGMSLRRVADLVGFSTEDLGKAMRDDPLFATQVRQAQAEAEAELLRHLRGAAQWQAWKFLLQSLYPARYVSSRKKPGSLKPPKLESEETRLRRLNAQELATLKPLVEKMDGKQTDASSAAQRTDGESVAGEDLDPVR